MFMARTCCVFNTQSPNVSSNKKAPERDLKGSIFLSKLIRNDYITVEYPLVDRTPCSFNYYLISFLSMHL